eukprot:gene11650-biopygen18416
MIRVGAGTSLASQRLSRDTSFYILSAWLAEMVSRHVGSKEMRCLAFWSWNHVQNPRFLKFSHFRFFVTGGSKRPGNSGLRAAIRTAARARSGPANYMGGTRE